MREDLEIAGIIVDDAEDEEVAGVVVDQVAGIIIQEAGGEPESA